MSRVLILGGTGQQAKAVAYYLAKYTNVSLVTLADIFEDRQRLELLKRITGKDIFNYEYFNIETYEIANFINKFDVCINCLPYTLLERATEFISMIDVDCCDLGGNTSVVQRQIKHWGPTFKSNNRLYVTNCGLAPGMNNQLAMMLYNEHKDYKCVDIKMFCGGLPDVAQNCPLTLKYHFPFSTEGLIGEYSGFCDIIRNGKHDTVVALEDLELVPTKRAVLEAFNTSGGSSLVPFKLPKNIRSYSYKTLRFQGHRDFLLRLEDLGCFDEEISYYDFEVIIERHKKRTCTSNLYNGPDFIVLKVNLDAILNENLVAKYITFECSNSDDLTAMEKATGFSVGIVANMLLKKEVVISNGVTTVEEAIDNTKYFEYLNKIPDFKIEIFANGVV